MVIQLVCCFPGKAGWKQIKNCTKLDLRTKCAVSKCKAYQQSAEFPRRFPVSMKRDEL